MSRFITVILSALMLSIVSGNVFAVAADARAAFVRGTVTATSEATNISRLLQRDSRVEVGETITTGPKGLAQIVFPDNSMLYIKADSSVKLEAFHFSADDPDKDVAVTEVLKGSMRALTGIVGKRSKDKVQYKTRVSTVGIRGTAIEIWQDGEAVTVDYGDVVVSNNGGVTELGEGQSAKTASVLTTAAPFRFERPSTDASVLARKLVLASPEEVSEISGEICKALKTEDALFLLGIQGQVPGFTPRVTSSTVKGLTVCFPVEQVALLLTTSVMIYPGTAPDLLRTAAGSEIDIDIALEAVLRGMEDPTPEQLGALFHEAIDQGLTKEQAGKVIDRIRDNGICR